MEALKRVRWEVDENGCHVCTSHCASKNGYSVIRIEKRNFYIHRLVYEDNFGTIPSGMVVRHKCDNRRCINPEHLEIGTQSDNMADMVAKKRQCHGERNGMAVLTEDDIKAIRESKLLHRELSAIYGVTRPCITGIKNYKTWKEVY